MARGRRTARARRPRSSSRLNREINAGLADGKLKAKIEALGYSVFPNTSAGLGSFMAGETDKWSQVIRTAGIKAN